MSIAIALLTGPLYFDLPQGAIGWLGWLALLLLLAALLRVWRGFQKKLLYQDWLILAGLVLLELVTSALFGLRLPAGNALPPPGWPVEPSGPALVFLAAVPWVLAAGLLGPWPAALLGLLSGSLIGLADTHSPFTPLEYALLGLALGAFLQQRYRTLFYRLMRHPLAALALLALLYPLVFLPGNMFMVQGDLAVRLDYALARLPYGWLAVAGQLLVAGLFGEVAAVLLASSWGSQEPLLPSPAERKLENRFLSGMVPLALVLGAVLIYSDWKVAGDAARDMVYDRMGSTAETAIETIPFFMEAGQNLIQQLATDPRLLSTDPHVLQEALSQDLRSVPFFRQLFIFDEKGSLLTGYPLDNYDNIYPPANEIVGIELALQGVPFQHYTVPPREGGQAAQVSFLAALFDEDGKTQRVLIGRAELETNLFIQPVLASIRNMAGPDGEGMLLDENGRVLYHTDAFQVMEPYIGELGDQAQFFDDTAPDGTRRLVYYQPGRSHAWSVVLRVPARRVQQMALNIAAPLLGGLLAAFLLGAVLLRLGVGFVTRSLDSLSSDADRIAGGQLDQALQIIGDDEVGQLSRAFEQMRISLKARLHDLNRLLLVSQGVASSLEVDEAVRPLLDAALETGASAVRVVLAPSVFAESEQDGGMALRFGQGSGSDLYAFLDHQVLALTRQQDRVMLNNLTRVRSLTFHQGSPRPEALLALALRHESFYYGSLWMAYDTPHQYSDDEIRFLVTLAGQAALAAANAHHFQLAETGRHRLASILASTPDPVVVTDQQGRLLLANPAAWHTLGLSADAPAGAPIETVTSLRELVRLMSSSATDKETTEIVLPDGHVYLATASSVMADGKRMGRVCLLRDITHFKELDTLKSEFVATVSHDLRSPLTLMRGYTTMLEMVGELNEQQSTYVKKIVAVVENMARLVNNLLDLGRIEAGLDLQLETVLLHDVIERVTTALQPQANQKNITLDINVPENTIPLIEADPALLQQALHNLVENAVKYTENGGKVLVSAFAREEGMVFQVNDSGIGVAPVDLPRLFEKFYRGVQRESKKQPGTGLGLAIVKSIAERHGGRVWVESQLGKGSTFFMLIPIRQIRNEAKASSRQVGP